MDERKTKPRYTIRKGGTEDVYLNKAGLWGHYANARRFRTSDAADRFAVESAIGDNYGLFPCSVSRKLTPKE